MRRVRKSFLVLFCKKEQGLLLFCKKEAKNFYSLGVGAEGGGGAPWGVGAGRRVLASG
jgi:hypothetical protein